MQHPVQLSRVLRQGALHRFPALHGHSVTGLTATALRLSGLTSIVRVALSITTIRLTLNLGQLPLAVVEIVSFRPIYLLLVQSLLLLLTIVLLLLSAQLTKALVDGVLFIGVAWHFGAVANRIKLVLINPAIRSDIHGDPP
ncbi:hypothetical protein [Endozoicomonas sp.]|uniref:hypothetical protein n=1 Tax=Endozoicomonas sp. TaxID=1892382 RepID=UPI003AF54F17